MVETNTIQNQVRETLFEMEVEPFKIRLWCKAKAHPPMDQQSRFYTVAAEQAVQCCKGEGTQVAEMLSSVHGVNAVQVTLPEGAYVTTPIISHIIYNDWP